MWTLPGLPVRAVPHWSGRRAPGRGEAAAVPIDRRGVDDDDQRTLLAVRVGGEIIGEMAAVDGEPRSATVVTCGDVSARRIELGELGRISKLHPDIDAEIKRTFSSRLRWANRQRIDLGAYDSRTRIGRIIVWLAEMHGVTTSEGVDLGLPLRQGELASMAGVALPTAEKALTNLDQQGLIARGYRRLVVRDLEGLRRVSQMTDHTPY
ncbi:Crp/Fnr family transcriptional regulator [Micromonospora sp. NPDC050187]|uniref:Crp/Fnr family transcriptional regulator n=1 Tax=Micromonospora sp. NPDC050187 TaxID=3364277 RepID=UPI0037B5ABE9